jgi:hypothetical protein
MTTVTRQSYLQDSRIVKSESHGSYRDPVIEGVAFKGNHLMFALSDGHSVAIHLLFYPRLLDASESERGNWNLIAGGRGITWGNIGEHISITGLLALRAERYPVDLLDA